MDEKEKEMMKAPISSGSSDLDTCPYCSRRNAILVWPEGGVLVYQCRDCKRYCSPARREA